MRLNIFFAFLFFSCAFEHDKNMTWNEINAEGLKKSNEEFNKMNFINENDGFLFGTNYTDEIILNKKFDQENAVIYRTIDGGKIWKGENIGYGRFVDAVSLGDTIYALTNKSSKNYYAVIDTSVLFVSRNMGQSWIKVHQFPFYVRDIRFMNSNEGIAVSENQGGNGSHWEIMKTRNSGKSWERISEAEVVADPIVNNGCLCYLSATKKAQGGDIYDKLIKINFETNVASSELLPIGVDGQFIRNFSGSDWLVGTKEKKVVVYKIEKDRSYTIVKEFLSKDLSPKYFNGYDNYLILILGESNFSNTIYKVFESENLGKGWQELPLPIPDYVNPVATFKNVTWIYSGAGKIQVRNQYR
jgi:hypothetical protein